MIIHRVANLDWLLAEPSRSKIEECEYGRFAWIMDPEGHRIESGEPPAPTK